MTQALRSRPGSPGSPPVAARAALVVTGLAMGVVGVVVGGPPRAALEICAALLVPWLVLAGTLRHGDPTVRAGLSLALVLGAWTLVTLIFLAGGAGLGKWSQVAMLLVLYAVLVASAAFRTAAHAGTERGEAV